MSKIKVMKNDAFVNIQVGASYLSEFNRAVTYLSGSVEPEVQEKAIENIKKVTNEELSIDDLTPYERSFRTFLFFIHAVESEVEREQKFEEVDENDLLNSINKNPE